MHQRLQALVTSGVRVDGTEGYYCVVQHAAATVAAAMRDGASTQKKKATRPIAQGHRVETKLATGPIQMEVEPVGS